MQQEVPFRHSARSTACTCTSCCNQRHTQQQPQPQLLHAVWQQGCDEQGCSGLCTVLTRSAAVLALQGAKNIAKIEIGTALWASAAAGGGAAVLGAAIGVPLLFRQLKTWDATM